MRAFFLLLSVVLLAAAWLFPFHRTPWTTFGSEILAFSAALSLLAVFIRTPIKIPKPQWMIAGVILVPLLQWAAGQVLYISNAILCAAYLLMFWLMIILGYNLSLTASARETLFKRFCLLLIGVGLLSSVMAIMQWFHLNDAIAPYINLLKGNRPYANFAQPNNLATFLSMSVLGCLYLYEKKLLKAQVLVPISLLFLFSIALTQSRTSWVVCLFVLVYLGIKQFNRPKRFGFIKSISWVAIYIAMIVALPYINLWIGSFADQQLVPIDTVVQRASSGYLRLDMWMQSLVAIGQHPWFGYGWNQTGMGQMAAFSLYPSHEWYKSAHNVILDLLLWNGVIIGGFILVYFVCWLYWLNRGVKESVSIVATLMVCAILIHALLEYPIHYGYFLLPMGFLLGIIQAQYPKLPSIQIAPIFSQVILLLGVVLIGVVWRDYDLYKYQSYLAAQKTLTAEQQQDLQQPIWLLTQFKDRVWWIKLNPYTQMSETELVQLGRMVSNTASRYDVFKYAQVLAFNDKKAEAEHQLWILQVLHGQTRSYSELVSLPQVSSK